MFLKCWTTLGFRRFLVVGVVMLSLNCYIMPIRSLGTYVGKGRCSYCLGTTSPHFPDRNTNNEVIILFARRQRHCWKYLCNSIFSERFEEENVHLAYTHTLQTMCVFASKGVNKTKTSAIQSRSGEPHTLQPFLKFSSYISDSLLYDVDNFFKLHFGLHSIAALEL